MPKKVLLRATQGADECNHSLAERACRVDNNGLVEVDEVMVAPLLEKGGFLLANPEIPAAPEGKVAVVHLHDVGASCSHGVPDEHGLIMVPIMAVPELLAHGFVPAQEAFAAPAAEPEAAVVEPVKAEKPAANAPAPAPEQPAPTAAPEAAPKAEAKAEAKGK